MATKFPFEMKFEMSTIKHLGLQMYSTLPPVIAELVANAWDANATTVEISIPPGQIEDSKSEIVIKDDGIGMSDSDIRQKYLVVGRDRRYSERQDRTPGPYERRIMGRKGIGKLSAFGIAREIEIESVHDQQTSRFIMNYDQMLSEAHQRRAVFPLHPPSGNVGSGTSVTLRKLTKFRTRPIPLKILRRGLARRFSVLDPEGQFVVVVNGDPISTDERDLKRLLETDASGQRYLWPIDEEITPGAGRRVSGWIGALKRTTRAADGIERGVSIMARGKMVQEPFTFRAGVGQQFALSYLVGEIHADFVDELEDTVGTSRNTLVWDAEANEELLKWGERKMDDIAREWARRRGEDNQRRIEGHKSYLEFKKRATDSGNARAIKLAEDLIKKVIKKNPTAKMEELEPIVRTCQDFVDFSAFWEIADDLVRADLTDTHKIFNLFKEWEIVEAKEMARVTEGRIKTIRKLQSMVDENAVEVPELHDFLREFPWVIDPRWTLVDDEVSYSALLREQFPEERTPLEQNRRIDFLCVRESGDLVVVEIKRPRTTASSKELAQIEDYVSFVRDHVKKTTDPDVRRVSVVGYLLCGEVADSYRVREKIDNLAEARIYVRRYRDLLEMVEKMHREFLRRYEVLRREARAGASREGLS